MKNIPGTEAELTTPFTVIDSLDLDIVTFDSNSNNLSIFSYLLIFHGPFPLQGMISW